jgi:hypothetical protein
MTADVAQIQDDSGSVGDSERSCCLPQRRSSQYGAEHSLVCVCVWKDHNLAAAFRVHQRSLAQPKLLLSAAAQWQPCLAPCFQRRLERRLGQSIPTKAAAFELSEI